MFEWIYYIDIGIDIRDIKATDNISEIKMQMLDFCDSFFNMEYHERCWRTKLNAKMRQIAFSRLKQYKNRQIIKYINRIID